MLTTRTHTSFRLNTALLDTLRSQAAASNRTLNSYVELLLTQSVATPLPREKTAQEEVENHLRTSFRQLKDFKDGKITLTRAEDLLDEL